MLNSGANSSLERLEATTQIIHDNGTYWKDWQGKKAYLHTKQIAISWGTIADNQPLWGKLIETCLVWVQNLYPGYNTNNRSLDYDECTEQRRIYKDVQKRRESSERFSWLLLSWESEKAQITKNLRGCCLCQGGWKGAALNNECDGILKCVCVCVFFPPPKINSTSCK